MRTRVFLKQNVEHADLIENHFFDSCRAFKGGSSRSGAIRDKRPSEYHFWLISAGFAYVDYNPIVVVVNIGSVNEKDSHSR